MRWRSGNNFPAAAALGCPSAVTRGRLARRAEARAGGGRWRKQAAAVTGHWGVRVEPMVRTVPSSVLPPYLHGWGSLSTEGRRQAIAPKTV